MKQLGPFILGAICSVVAVSALSQGTAFLYQGQLSANGSPANGVYDMAFALFNAGGGQVGNALTNNSTAVSNGLFSVTLDYGPGVFNGSNLWLQISVRTNGGGPFTALAPMQPVLPAPFAILAAAAGTLTGPLPAAQLSGVCSNSVAFDNAANSFIGSFSGDGSGLANVNAALLDGLAGSNYATLASLTNYATLASLAASQSAPSIPNFQVFDSAGTFQFIVPSNITTIAVEVWGGGGGGGGSTYTNQGSGGGAGGYGKGVFTVTPGDTNAVVVGAGGAGGTGGAGGAAASPGGASSFGTLISAGGGFAGTNAQTFGLGSAGGASTAPINITGGAGQWTTSLGGNYGGSAGNGGSGGWGDAGSGAGAGQAPGGGGGGGEGGDPGGSGGGGRVIVYY
jgi:hypothetical protein